MTEEERDIITRYIERVSGAGRALSGPGSVPGTVQPLPPVDAQADELIGQLMQRYPQARYRLTQTAFVQEQALNAAQGQIAQLQTALQEAKQAQPAAAGGGGFFQNLFGSGQSRPQPPPQNPAWGQPQYAQPQNAQPQYAQPQYAQPQYPPQGQYAPGYQPGMFQRPGSGFLGSALTTAAGVAGGMVAGNALMNLFEGHHGGGGFGGGYGEPYGGGQPGYGGGPWGGEPAAPDAQVTGSAWDNQTEQSAAGWNDATGNDAPPDTSGGWDGGGGDSGGGGWDDGSGS